MSIERIRAALAAGPTPGPWSVETVPTSCGVCHKVGPFPGRRPGDPPRHACLYADYPSQGNPADDELEANAAFIAACNPAAIRALLAEHDALKAENERLREFERSVALTLPGVYYMDPPDGGDVSLLKQLKRMANDAARYRLLRRKFAIISDGEGHAEFCAINLPRPTYIAPNTAIELDTALDRERLGLDGAKRPPTPVGWSDTDWIKHLQEQPRPVRHNQTEQEE